MKRSSCSRTWQAEALEDGRLPAEDVAAFERHAATCSACAEEVTALDQLRRLGQQLPVLESSPLARRRKRHELLGRANEVALRGSTLRWPHMLAAGAALVACLSALFLYRAPPALPAAARAAPTYQLIGSRDALVRVLERAATVRLAAGRGHLEIAVDKLHAGQRFLLMLPDGELEVQGTRFSVDAETTRTRRVSVSEGRVALRLRGHAERILRAGDSWSREAAPATRSRAAPGSATDASDGDAASANVDAAAPGVEPEPRARGHEPRARGHEPRARGPEPRARGHAERSMDAREPAARSVDAGARAPSRTPAATGAGRDFALAMSAFSAGDNQRAEQLFATFEQIHPDDARVEDALFLRAVARARRGDVEASRALARSYLQRHPHGLRRREAERLAR
jgi:TolA-binding protein